MKFVKLLNLSLAFVFLPCANSYASDKDGKEAVAESNSIELLIEKIEETAAQDEIKESRFQLAVLASRLVAPDISSADLKLQIEKMAVTAKQAWKGETLDEKIIALNRVFFGEYKFTLASGQAPIISGKGIYETYSLPGVLKGKKGHCVGLSTLYMIIGEVAGLPISLADFPVHTMCRVEEGDEVRYIECTRRGRIYNEQAAKAINKLNEKGRNSGIYFTSQNKKQFLAQQLNFLVYGFLNQKEKKHGLSMEQMLRLAKVIEDGAPNHPESIETVAQVYFKANDHQKAVKLINHSVKQATLYGTPGWVMKHYNKEQKRMQAKAK